MARFGSAYTPAVVVPEAVDTFDPLARLPDDQPSEPATRVPPPISEPPMPTKNEERERGDRWEGRGGKWDGSRDGRDVRDGGRSGRDVWDDRGGRHGDKNGRDRGSDGRDGRDGRINRREWDSANSCEESATGKAPAHGASLASAAPAVDAGAVEPAAATVPVGQMRETNISDSTARYPRKRESRWDQVTKQTKLT